MGMAMHTSSLVQLLRYVIALAKSQSEVCVYVSVSELASILYLVFCVYVCERE